MAWKNRGCTASPCGSQKGFESWELASKFAGSNSKRFIKKKVEGDQNVRHVSTSPARGGLKTRPNGSALFEKAVAIKRSFGLAPSPEMENTSDAIGATPLTAVRRGPSEGGAGTPLQGTSALVRHRSAPQHSRGLLCHKKPGVTSLSFLAQCIHLWIPIRSLCFINSRGARGAIACETLISRALNSMYKPMHKRSPPAIFVPAVGDYDEGRVPFARGSGDDGIGAPSVPFCCAALPGRDVPRCGLCCAADCVGFP